MSALAAKLILENRASQSPFLDLANCGLSRLPLELGELTWLETLALSDGWLESAGQYQRVRKSPNQEAPNRQLKNLSAIAPLKRLQTLYLNDTELADLSTLPALPCLSTLSLANNPLTDLAALAQLKKLEWLNLADTRVHDLQPLAGLHNLQWLKLSGSDIADCTPLATLTGLTTLELDKTAVSDLGPLAGLERLTTLNLNSSQAGDLGPLTALHTLTTLNLSHTRVSDLTPLKSLIAQGRPVVLKAAMWGNDGITVEACPLQHPPPEQVLQGKAAMLAWFAEQKKQGNTLLQEARLVLFGRTGYDTARLLRQFRISRSAIPFSAAGGPGSVRSGNTLGPALGPGNSTLGLEVGQGSGPACGHYDFIAANGYPFRLHVWHFEPELAGFTALPALLAEPCLFLLLDQSENGQTDPAPHSPAARLQADWLRLIRPELACEAEHPAPPPQAAPVPVGHETQAATSGADAEAHTKPQPDDAATALGSAAPGQAAPDVHANAPILLFRQQSGAHSLHLQETRPGLQGCYGGDLSQVDNARALRVIIEEMLGKLPLCGERVPQSWLKIRQALEQQSAPLLPYADFLALCQQHWPDAEPDEIEPQAQQLCARLHASGAILHFSQHPRLRETLITNVPQVITTLHALTQDETIIARNYRFDRADCLRLWQIQAEPLAQLRAESRGNSRANFRADSGDELASELQTGNVLLDLLQHLEWAAPLPSGTGYLLCHELPPHRHEMLRKWQQSGDWVGLFRHQSLARNLIPRLLLRLLRFVAEPKLASTRCLLLKHGTSFVLVELASGKPEVRLSARGPARDALLKIVQTELTAINHGQPLVRIRPPPSTPSGPAQPNPL